MNLPDVINPAQAEAHAEEGVLHLVQFTRNPPPVIRGQQGQGAFTAQRGGAALGQGRRDTWEIKSRKSAGIESHLGKKNKRTPEK